MVVRAGFSFRWDQGSVVLEARFSFSWGSFRWYVGQGSPLVGAGFGGTWGRVLLF